MDNKSSSKTYKAQKSQSNTDNNYHHYDNKFNFPSDNNYTHYDSKFNFPGEDGIDSESNYITSITGGVYSNIIIL